MADFYDRFHLPPTKATPEGDEFEIVYELVTDRETGYKTLVPTGEKRPIQAMIEASAGINVLDLDECFRRYVEGEEVKLIIRPVTDYGDARVLGSDALEAYQKATALKEKLDKAFADAAADQSAAAAPEEKGSANNES